MDNETEMPVSFVRAPGEYLKAIVGHDDSMEKITSSLLNAQSWWPAPLSERVVTEALESLAALQGKTSVGLEHRLYDEEMDVAEMEFEQVMRVSLTGNDRPKAAKR